MLRFKEKFSQQRWLSRMEEVYLMRGLLGPFQAFLVLVFLGSGLLCPCVARGHSLEYFILGRGCIRSILVLDRTLRRFLWRRSEFLLNPLHRIPIAGDGNDQGTSALVRKHDLRSATLPMYSGGLVVGVRP